MAFNAFTVSNLVSEGLLQSLAMAEQFIALSLADTQDLFSTPVIYYVGDASGKGSNVLRHRLIGLGHSIPMTATAAETTDVSASSVSGTYADVTIARRALRLDESGLAQVVGGGFGLDPQSLGMTTVESFKAGRMAALGEAIAGASTNVTSSGTGSVDDLYDVIDTFSALGYSGQLIGMFKSATLASIRDSLRSEVGPVAYRGDVQAFRAMGAEEILGIACIPSTHVTSNAGKYENAVMASGAIAYGIGSPSNVLTNANVIRPAGLPVVIDLEKNASADTLEIVANGYDGLAIREQARIVGLLAST
jgi:hypothetical protein